ncbi:hypothetical protein [Kutzneria sp. 744]|uniref:hypothetical protein n=1 Tax=Kutzneria sp. (strain 744) TaxID=345341 RepID=UPI0003EEB4C8|nr:hypothetical protein [Kutzneria sp. 744]EWM18061.1 cell surface glycoprotein [Kutzneria sp. 744]
MQMGVFRRLAAIGAVVLFVLASTTGVAQAAASPLGKQNWVVSLASFTPSADHTNSMRLGYLVFDPASKFVKHDFWLWKQQDYPIPVNSGDVYYCGQWHPGTNPKNNCAIRTGAGFTGEPNGHYTGTYAYDATAGQVIVTWTDSTVNGVSGKIDLGETWAVSQPRTGLGRLALTANTYGLTTGIGYGSNASLAAKASMTTIHGAERPYVLEGQGWNSDQVATWARGHAGALTVGPTWNACDDASCLGFVQYNAGCDANSCCPKDANHDACVQKIKDTGDRRFYSMTGILGGRRDSYEFYCECLAYGKCYLANSHVRPMLQVLDDAGVFQGWVGAEVSPHVGAGGRHAEADHYASFALVS